MEKLPSTEKEKMLPIVLLAPWLNSIKFQNTFDVIEKSVGDVPMIVDLDRDYQSSAVHESRVYFRNLLSGPEADQNWIELIENHVNYIPTIQNYGNDAQIITQIEAFKAFERGYVFRVPVYLPGQIDFVKKWIDPNSLENQLVILDGGWRDY